MNTTGSSSHCDTSLGPTASHCGAQSRFDFTLAFEQSALAITPDAIFLSAAIPRLVYLWTHECKVAGRLLHLIKLTTSFTFATLQFSLVVIWSLYHGPIASRLGIVSSALRVTSGLVLAALSYLEHERAVRPSTVLCVYLFLSILFDAAQCRTLWLLYAQQHTQQQVLLPALFTAQLVTKLGMLFVEAFSKTRYLAGSWATLKRCPEAVASVFSRATFWWLNDLFVRGFSATLDLDTLYETDNALHSSKLLVEFRHHLAKAKPSKYRLAFVILKCHKMTFIKTVLARLSIIGLKFIGPFLLQYIIEFVQNDQQGDEYRQQIGYALIAATGLLYISTAVATGFYNHHRYRGLTMIRGGLVSLVCTGSLGLSAGAASEMASLTLIAADVDVICGAFSGLHDLWANPIEIGIATWLLARQLGVGCIGPILSAVFCFVVTSQLPKRMGPAIKAWNIAIQKRVATTAQILTSMRGTMMLGLVPTWLRNIQSLRIAELNESKRFRTLIVYMNVFSNLTPCLAPVLTFGTTLAVRRHARNSGLDSSTVFTSLSIMGLMMSPLNNLLSSFPSFVSSLGIFERFEGFFEQAKFRRSISNQLTVQETGALDSSSSAIELRYVPRNRITLRNAFFSAEIGGEALLYDISLSINPGEFYAVCGQVGSGKSLLLQALLGELAVIDGEAEIDMARIGYCSQSPWLFEGTIRDNIVAWTVYGFDESRYNAVVKACGLDTDLAQLPEGDMTVVTTKGNSLSGGQRHRVALARALFAAPPMFVIDDILASLDENTRNYVWTHVFGPGGLIRQLGACVVMATHSTRIMEQANHVITMDQGCVWRQGPYAAPHSEKSPAQPTATLAAEQSPAVTTKSAHAVAESKQDEIKQKIDDLVQSHGDTSLYKYYFKSVGWKYSTIALSLAAGIQVLVIMRQIWLKWWTESNSSNSLPRDGMYFGVYCVFSLGIVTAIGIDIWFMFVMMIPKSAGNLHRSLLQTALRAPLSFFTSSSIGNLVNRFSQDMTLIDQDLPTAVFTCLKGLFAVIGTGALIMLGSAYLATTIPLGLAILYALQKFYLRTSRQLRLLQLRACTPLFLYLVENADGLATIRAFRWEVPLQSRAMLLLDRSQRPHYLLYAIQRWLKFVLDMMVGGLAVLLVALAVALRQSGPATTAISFSSALGFGTVLAEFITSWTQLETSLGAIARVQTFEETTPSELENPGTMEPPADWPSRGHIKIFDLWASYKTSSSTVPSESSATVPFDEPIGETDSPVLRQLAMTIQPGEKMAICGRIGSGKSSLLLTLYRLLRYTGTTTIDGLDISLVPLDTLRARLITIPQEPVIFPGTIRLNLCPDISTPCADDETLLDALAQVSLRDAVIAIPGGLDADITKASLSHGQKQLLCLARALIRKSSGASSGRVLILDEATSAVDDATERLMVKVIEQNFSTYTVLAVTHRLESVRRFDRLVVLDQGTLVKSGAPDELMTENGQLRV